MSKPKNKGGRPLKFKSVKALQRSVDEYLAGPHVGWVDREIYDKKTDSVRTVRLYEPPTITGLAKHLDVCTETLRNYEAKDKFFATIKRAKQECEHGAEYGAMIGAANPTMCIFTLKNNFGWKDKTETDSTQRVVIQPADIKTPPEAGV